MPTLNWIGKENVVSFHQQVPYHTLSHKYGFTDTDGEIQEHTGSGNKIIHGDNLIALKSLLPEYQGRIDCIYIDPPYNTGEEKWIYNDNVNDSHAQKWLGEVVGKKDVDFTRHDKWLCMMYPRLALLQKLLSNKGFIFISIDDNEYVYLKCICDAIFGSSNFIATFIWEKRKNRENRKAVSVRHDYILCYSKNPNSKLKLLGMTPEALGRYTNPDNDPNGLWKSDPATAQAGHATDKQFYELIAPNGKTHVPPKGRCWIYTKEIMQHEIEEGHIWFGETGNNVPRIKTYLNDKDRGLVPETIWFSDDVSTTENAKNKIKEIFQEQSPFETPKPVELIRRILEISTDKDSIVLDSYAGSAATAQAVIEQNKEDGGNRKFILIELMDYAENITAERVKRVITGYPYTGKVEEVIYSKKLSFSILSKIDPIITEVLSIIENKKSEYSKISKPKIVNDSLVVTATQEYETRMPGLGGAFDFYELGIPVFDADGFLNPMVELTELRQYVFFAETQSKIDNESAYELTPYLGTKDRTDYYFFYGENSVLNMLRLQELKQKAEHYVIYAESCLLTQEELNRFNITFKKIPRDIIKF